MPRNPILSNGNIISRRERGINSERGGETFGKRGSNGVSIYRGDSGEEGDNYWDIVC